LTGQRAKSTFTTISTPLSQQKKAAHFAARGIEMWKTWRIAHINLFYIAQFGVVFREKQARMYNKLIN
jgi:hypothetical protein